MNADAWIWLAGSIGFAGGTVFGAALVRLDVDRAPKPPELPSSPPPGGVRVIPRARLFDDADPDPKGSPDARAHDPE